MYEEYLVFLRVGGSGVGRGGVSWGGVSGSFVGGFVLGVFGFSGVFNLGDVAAVVIDGVGDGLSAAIGQKHVVRSRHDFTVAALLVAEVVVGVVIYYLVGEVVGHSGLMIKK